MTEAYVYVAKMTTIRTDPKTNKPTVIDDLAETFETEEEAVAFIDFNKNKNKYENEMQYCTIHRRELP